MTNQAPVALQPALALMERGDLPGARVALDEALAADPNSRELREIAGLLAARAGDSTAVIAHNRVLFAGDPDHPTARYNLATALVADRRLTEAAPLLEGATEPKLRRLAAYVHHEQGHLVEAIADYEAVVAADGADFQSWNNLGNARLAVGDAEGAAIAFDRAVQLRPEIVSIYLSLSQVLGQLRRLRDRREVMRAAFERAPDDAQVLTELGLAEAGMRDMVAAERALRSAIRRAPGEPAAYIELGLLYETANEVEALDRLVVEAERAGVGAGEVSFLRAWSLRRRGDAAGALAEAERIPQTVRALRRSQMLGDMYERAGRTEEAFREYQAMNASALAASPPPPARSYRSRVEANAALLTPEWIASWSPAAVAPTPAAPVFLVGFPRSGTTLLDTMLMNLPRLHVMEEQPVFSDATREVGLDDAAIAALSEAEVARMRRLYFERLAVLDPAPADALIVDKHPLQMARVALIHRIFPEARFILVERHPCDAVLSCYMANFNMNAAMRSFTNLEEAARTYDAVFGLWTKATALLPVQHVAIRYERLIADPEAEMRPLLEFLDQPWNSAVLDNQASAAQRGVVRTASYSQVTEPLYTRAVARWERYRDQLEPVLPILRPWAERMGYPL